MIHFEMQAKYLSASKNQSISWDQMNAFSQYCEVPKMHKLIFAFFYKFTAYGKN
jgi:hypothetical protein